MRDPRLDPSVGVGGLENRLLFVAGTFAQHAVQPQADEQCDQRKDHNDGQFGVLFVSDINIVRLA
jgi:hypothetical protein